MPRGDKSKYSSKQKRMASDIEKGYKKRGVSTKESARRAWATVNAETGGAGKPIRNKRPSRKGGRIGGRSVSHATRVRAGTKAAATRRRHASH